MDNSIMVIKNEVCARLFRGFGFAHHILNARACNHCDII